MTELSDEIFSELRKIDTPTITNVVATYPKNPLCLGLYNPWTENWYTDSTIRCIYPELGPTVGYAVTCVYGLPDPNYQGRLSFMDVIDALDAMKKPTILVIQQKWPPELHNKAGLAGEMMVSSMMAVGCIGMLSNGPSRDVDAIRRLKFQYMLGGVTAGHGEMAVQAVNVPVSVGGMDVAPGDLVGQDKLRFAVIGERPGALAVAGAALVIVAVVLLADPRSGSGRAQRGAVVLALCAGVMIGVAVITVVSQTGTNLGSTFTKIKDNLG